MKKSAGREGERYPLSSLSQFGLGIVNTCREKIRDIRALTTLIPHQEINCETQLDEQIRHEHCMEYSIAKTKN